MVNRYNIDFNQELNKNHYKPDWCFYKKLVCFFFKKGNKLKKQLLIQFNLSNFFFNNTSFDYPIQPNGIGGSIMCLRFLFSQLTIEQNLSLKINDLTLNKLQLVLKHEAVNRQVKKYSKGKLKYRKRLYLLNEAKTLNYALRLWKLALLVSEYGEIQIEKYFFLSILNMSFNEDDTISSPFNIELKLLDDYFKKLKIA